MHADNVLFIFRRIPEPLLSRSNNSTTLLLDACSLTGELAQIVELGAANLTYLVHLDALDVGRLDGENTLHTHCA